MKVASPTCMSSLPRDSSKTFRWSKLIKHRVQSPASI